MEVLSTAILTLLKIHSNRGSVRTLSGGPKFCIYSPKNNEILSQDCSYLLIVSNSSESKEATLILALDISIAQPMT